MSILEKLEQLLTQSVEQSLAKVFAGRVHPVEIARKLELEAGAKKRVSLSGVLVPDLYQVDLAPSDYAELEPISAGLADQLADYVMETASREGYLLVASPEVKLQNSEALRPGQFQVRGSFSGKSPACLLKVEAGPQTGLEFSFAQPRIILGRSNNLDVTLDDPRVSRKHCQITFDGSQFHLADLNSSNGTFLDNKQVKEAILRPRQALGLGVSILRFDVPLWSNIAPAGGQD